MRSEPARPRLDESVAQRLAAMILDRPVAPGEMLPSEGELAAHFGVGRSTMREAVRRLAAQGLVEVRHGVGVFAGDTTARSLSDALARLLQRQRVGPEALLEARQLLEVEIAGLAAERATAADLDALEEALRRLGRTDAPLEQQIAADGDFHLALAQAAHNPVYLAVSEAVRQPVLESMRATYPVDGGPARRHREHDAIFQAVRSGRPTAARAAMVLLLETTAEAIRRLTQPSAKTD